MLDPEHGIRRCGWGAQGGRLALFSRCRASRGRRDGVVEHIQNLHQALWRAVITRDHFDIVLGAVVALAAVLAVVGYGAVNGHVTAKQASVVLGVRSKLSLRVRCRLAGCR